MANWMCTIHPGVNLIFDPEMVGRTHQDARDRRSHESDFSIKARDRFLVTVEKMIGSLRFSLHAIHLFQQRTQERFDISDDWHCLE